MKRRTPVAFRIDQALIDAPAFPRPVDWWAGFLPPWVSIVSQQPDGSILAVVDCKARGDSLARIITQGPAGRRLAAGVTVVEAPAQVPRSRWDIWLENWRNGDGAWPPTEGQEPAAGWEQLALEVA